MHLCHAYAAAKAAAQPRATADILWQWWEEGEAQPNSTEILFYSFLLYLIVVGAWWHALKVIVHCAAKHIAVGICVYLAPKALATISDLNI